MSNVKTETKQRVVEFQKPVSQRFTATSGYLEALVAIPKRIRDDGTVSAALAITTHPVGFAEVRELGAFLTSLADAMEAGRP